jgi:hypothetical protein
LGSILVLAAVGHQIEGAFVLLLLYGMGAALPMLAFAYGGRYLSRRLLSLRPHTEQLHRVGGAIVVRHSDRHPAGLGYTNSAMARSPVSHFTSISHDRRNSPTQETAYSQAGNFHQSHSLDESH